MLTFVRRLFGVGLLAGAGYAGWTLWQRQGVQPAPADPPEWPPIAPAGTSTSTAAALRLAGPDEGSQRWVPPVDGACPDGYPVKANDNSGIYHVPGGRSYERTVPERCYANPVDAEADGYRAAKV